MKPLIYSLIIFSILLFACSISSTVTPPVLTAPPVITAPPDVTAPPVVTEPLVVTALLITNNVTCNELSLYLDPALGSSTNCETVPEVPEGIMVYPQYTKVTLQGYVLSGKSLDPQISVMPVQRYTELLPDFMPGNLADLQNLIGGGSPDDSGMPFGSSLPFLPTFNAGQIFHAQYQTLPFASGGGIRYITLLAQNYAVINNQDLLYTYQGLTSDGKYWVSVILPVTNPVLPENGDTLPGGQTFEQFINTYSTYAAGVISQLNTQTPGSFTPSLGMLDALSASITIQP